MLNVCSYASETPPPKAAPSDEILVSLKAIYSTGIQQVKVMFFHLISKSRKALPANPHPIYHRNLVRRKNNNAIPLSKLHIESNEPVILDQGTGDC